jgi:ribosomal protein S18 acetylase RimI-like enzyme
MATSDDASPYNFEPLSPSHDRTGFKSGVAPLDRYFVSQVTQDIRRRVSACFVAVERASGAIVGFYTVAASAIPLLDVAPAAVKKLPRYPLVPAVRVGRLATAETHRGRGIGAGLLLDAASRAFRSEIAAFAIVVDAKDDAAAAFYRRYGFTPFATAPMSLYLPLAEFARAMGLKPMGGAT